MNKVSIIIVNYNGEKYIGACLESIFAQDYKDIEVIVIDNNSTDKSLVAIKRYPVNQIIELKKNVGFGIGNNIGVEMAKGEFIALLNPDTIVDRRWLVSLVETIKTDKKIGITGSKIYFRDTNYLDSAGSIYNNILVAWSRGVYEKDEGQYDNLEEVPMITACSMLFKREILDKTYLFDPDFFMYVEEVDFCMRVRNLGYSIIYNPKSVLNHFVSQSVAQLKINSVIFKQFHGSINRAKAIGLYLSFKDILKNLHLIFASFLFWNWYFLWHGKWWLSLKMLTMNWIYFIKGLSQRTNLTRNNNWAGWMKQMSFFDMLKFRNDLEKKSLFIKNNVIC